MNIYFNIVCVDNKRQTKVKNIINLFEGYHAVPHKSVDKFAKRIYFILLAFLLFKNVNTLSQIIVRTPCKPKFYKEMKKSYKLLRQQTFVIRKNSCQTIVYGA